jgi:FkbM family methyltransferase
MLTKIIRAYKRNKRKLKLLKLAQVKLISPTKLFLSYQGVEGFHLPYNSKSKIDYRQLFMVSQDLPKWLIEKYTTDSIGLKHSDTVIDCGAFVGGFTIASMHFGVNKVYSIEPSSKNFDCLKSNITHYNYDDKVTPINIGLDKKPGELRLNLSESGCDDSFLEPDEGDLKSVEVVKTRTLQSVIEEYKIDPKNLYLKVEAEGFEPEVIYGLGNVLPRVIVVDITPERDGLSPVDEIEDHLQNMGYRILKTDRCLFAYQNSAYA